MPADYLSRLLATERNKNIANIDVVNHTSMSSKWRTEHCRKESHQKNGRTTYQNGIATTYRLKQTRCSKIRTKSCGWEYTTSTTQGWDFICLKKYCKGATCEAHFSISGSHNATQKTYLRISTSYYWPKMLQATHHCQFWKDQTSGFTLFYLAQWSQLIATKHLCSASLMPSQNTPWSLRLHIKKLRQLMILCTRNGFPSSVFLLRFTWMEERNSTFEGIFWAPECQPNKNITRAPTMQSTGRSLQKTVPKIMQSFVNDTALNWETFFPALALSYNTSYHLTIATTPFE